jgi:hypothetical protein
LQYYRAQIIAVTESGYKVHFIDYGNQEDVAPNDIVLATVPQPQAADPSAMAAVMAAAALSAQSPPPAGYYYN